MAGRGHEGGGEAWKETLNREMSEPQVPDKPCGEGSDHASDPGSSSLL